MDNKNLDTSTMLGYVALACTKLNMTDEKTKKMINTLLNLLNEVSPDQAKQHYEQNEYLSINKKGNSHLENDRLFEYNVRKRFFPQGASKKQTELLSELSVALKESYQAGFQKGGFMGFEPYSVEGILGLIVIALQRSNRSDRQIVNTLYDVYSVLGETRLEYAAEVYEGSDYKIDLKRKIEKEKMKYLHK
ncbi:hypothetical protein [Paenibacillus polymyxa]|uniref:hypothetical protein n=1 Tax=Paenibacillus polymyxa TaxID=1406 RepID=UPI002AB486F3|nr:hypothetical protein [Paenibacillus polymyxa]MDY8023400.1 hypothetical protein [Paenibacillus polymyxa]